MKVTIDEIPYRSEFVDKKRADLEENIIAACGRSAPLYFMPNSSSEVLSGDNYYILLYGVVGSGVKVTVALTEVPCFFDVRVEKESPEAFKEELKLILIDRRVHFSGIEIKKAYRASGFKIEPDHWIRIHFLNIRQRKTALSFVQKMRINPADMDSPTRVTAYDDDGYMEYYYPMIARLFDFNTCGWNKISSWTVATPVNREEIRAVDKHALMVPLKSYTRALPDEIASMPWAQRDPKMIMDWDIETYSWSRVDEEVPPPESKEWKLFMLNANFHWYYTTATLLKVCLVDHPIAVTDNNYYTLSELVTKSNKTGRSLESLIAAEGRCITIVCGNQRGILLAFIQLLSRMRPEIITAFNAVGFDWPRIRELLSRENLLCEFEAAVSLKAPKSSTSKYVYDKLWAQEGIKISAEETMDVTRLAAPGIVDTDMMPTFKKLYPRSEVQKQFSLNFFLSKNGLPSKEDMPYKEMFRIYAVAESIANGSLLNQNIERIAEKYATDMVDTTNLSAEEIFAKSVEIAEKEAKKLVEEITAVNLKEMASIAKYCTVDAYRCQQLQVVRSIVQDACQLANDSALPLFDGIWRANGRKIRQLVGIHCHTTKQYDHPVALSYKKTNNQKFKFEGAFVIPPKRGLNKRRPVVGVDFSSLYPSLMMAYNLSGETVIHNTPEGRALVEELIAKGYTLEPISFNATVDDEGSTDNNKIIAFEGWVVRHNNVLEIGDLVGTVGHFRQGEQPLPREIMGIFGSIQRSLFSDRRVYKLRYVKLKHLLEKMAAMKIEGSVDWEKDLSDKDFAGTGIKFENIIEATKSSGTTIEESIEFELNLVNSKQSAKKIFMNTFYGESGNFRSIIYDLIVAGGVTSKGKKNLRMVEKFLYDNGYDVPYGDTDSCYTCPPDRLFVAVDKVHAYAAGIVEENLPADQRIDHREIPKETTANIDEQFAPAYTEYLRDTSSIGSMQVAEECSTVDEAFTKFLNNIITIALKLSSERNDIGEKNILWSWTRFVVRHEYYRVCVQITRRDATRLVKRIGDMLHADNGTRFLNMDYEEVLFPTNFIGKKKYIGIAHHASEVFYPAIKDIFVKGIDVVKQGQTELAREIGYDLIKKVLDIMNEKDMLCLVQEKIDDLVNREWDLKYFILTKKYKPAKKNISVLKFVERMRLLHAKYTNVEPSLAKLYEPPEGGDPFKYVVVHKEVGFTVNGCKIAQSVGDKMEFVRVYEHMAGSGNPMKIDFNHYISGALGGQLGRFIAYHDMFQPPEGTYDDPDKIDEHSCKAATKYVLDLCKNDNDEASILRKRGIEYRSVAKTIVKKIKLHLLTNFYEAGKIFEICDLYNSKSDLFVDTKMQEWEKHKLITNVIIAYALDQAELKGNGLPYVEALKDRLKSYKNANLLTVHTITNSKGIAVNLSTRRNKYTWLEEQAALAKKDINLHSTKILNAVNQWSNRINEAIVRARDDADDNLEAELLYVNTFTEEERFHCVGLYKSMTRLSGVEVWLRLCRSIALYM